MTGEDVNEPGSRDDGTCWMVRTVTAAAWAWTVLAALLACGAIIVVAAGRGDGSVLSGLVLVVAPNAALLWVAHTAIRRLTARARRKT